jgi:hypothetical protein
MGVRGVVGGEALRDYYWGAMGCASVDELKLTYLRSLGELQGQRVRTVMRGQSGEDRRRRIWAMMK